MMTIVSIKIIFNSNNDNNNHDDCDQHHHVWSLQSFLMFASLLPLTLRNVGAEGTHPQLR